MDFSNQNDNAGLVAAHWIHSGPTKVPTGVCTAHFFRKPCIIYHCIKLCGPKINASGKSSEKCSFNKDFQSKYICTTTKQNIIL